MPATCYAVYDLETRELRSVGSVLADPLPAGLGVKALDAMPDLAVVGWDAASLAFVPHPPDPLGLALTADGFRQRFTFAERVASKQAAATDARVAVLLEDVASAPTIRLAHARTAAGVQLLQSVGVLTAERAAEILDPAWVPAEDA